MVTSRPDRGRADDTDRALEELRLRGHRMTPQRRAIVAEIMGTPGHISPQAIAQRVQTRVPGVNASTVYRTLDLLEELGIVSHAHMEQGAEYHRSEHRDHLHLICGRCGRSESRPADDVEPSREEFARHTGFLPDFTHFAISGLCETCRRERERAG
jgi:Fur family transcriptional regulator, ferric uptake regulator